MFIRFLIGAALAMLIATPATAGEWTNQYSKDEFDGKDRYLAISSEKAPFLAFVCDAETARLRLLFNTGEKPGRGLQKSLPVLGWVAVIVDDQPVRSYPGRVAEMGRRLVFESYDDGIIDFGKLISAAQRRVLIAIEQSGEKYFRQEFAVAGSGTTISKLFGICAKLKAKRG